MIDACDAIQQLEAALFKARNGKVKFFVGVYLDEDKGLWEIIYVPQESAVMATGATYGLLKDVSNKIGSVKWEGVQDIVVNDEQCEECIQEFHAQRTGIVVPMLKVGDIHEGHKED